MLAVLAAKQIQYSAFMLWLGIAIAIVVAAGVAVVWYRRKVLGSDQADDQGGMLDDLKAMRDSGEISLEEFDAAKQAIVSRLAGKPSPRPVSPARKERVAAPGFDLTGAPLPQRQDPDNNPER